MCHKFCLQKAVLHRALSWWTGSRGISHCIAFLIRYLICPRGLLFSLYFRPLACVPVNQDRTLNSPSFLKCNKEFILLFFGAIAEYPAHSFTFVGSLRRTRQITIGTILIQWDANSGPGILQFYPFCNPLASIKGALYLSSTPQSRALATTQGNQDTNFCLRTTTITSFLQAPQITPPPPPPWFF